MKKCSVVLFRVMLVLLSAVSLMACQQMVAAATPMEVVQQEEALFSPGQDTLRKKLIELIDAEQSSLKIAIYRLTDPAIIDAISRAIKRNIVVDIVVDGLKMQADVIHLFMRIVNSPVIPKNLRVKIPAGNQYGIMHHKFVIFETNKADSKLVWVGSYNFTSYQGSEQTHDNAVILSDPFIFARFWYYFNELSGLPKTSYKFNTEEVARDPNVIKIAFFTPQKDDCVKALWYLIQFEKCFIKIAMDEFTHPILLALIEGQAERVPVELVIFKVSPAPDQTKLDYGDIQRLQKYGVKVYEYKQKNKELMHHKFAIFANSYAPLWEKTPNGKPLVWTGSYNFTKAAQQKNCESAVIVDTPQIVQRFNVQFEELKQHCQLLENTHVPCLIQLH